MKDSMDGKNIETVLLELGTRLHRVIYDHLLVFQYSSVGKYLSVGVHSLSMCVISSYVLRDFTTTTGALSVICDVGEYRKCVKEFKIPFLNTMFDTLHALCNLLLVLPKDLNQYFNREELVSG